MKFICLSRFYTVAAMLAGLMILASLATGARAAQADLPDEVLPTLHYLLERVGSTDTDAFDIRQIEPFIDFLLSPKPDAAVYRADGSFDAPSAYHEFKVDTDLDRIIGYTLNADIPSFFLWPSSLRMARWTRVEGGDAQFRRMREAVGAVEKPFILKGTEHITITPDQHTGAYYTYDTDKAVILTPFKSGKAVISIYRQQEPSEVGRKGWVLGDDNDWSYLYTQDTGLNVGGLGWARTYMYDSFGCTIYYQPDPAVPTLICGVVSWVRAGWAGINMVQPKHIHKGLVRVATAFKDILEDPRLPEPDILAKPFVRSKQLPTPVLEKYGRDYFASLKNRISKQRTLMDEIGDELNEQRMLEQMSRDELYAVLALDYFKKVLGRNPVIQSHPF